ncbi:polymorphic toxin type 33 domain-containing protein [Chroococcus sp. FPU101]|uniref:polymorphic toxin type 33 domain-containing protein n=1 Tax=Chroococcus sp. FPU101 TaxID=1974212 RepID=UPI001A90A1DC|nr:polymorphic toxin type 33 domain-containing protein [Chroococcus sp. FPU101]GFE69890.1 hypothetical protein CFPU101_25000 [Chroococcus sp. FPU101]
MTDFEPKGKDSERNWRQDKLLTRIEIARLKQAGIDIHELKGKYKASQKDLYKDSEGNIYIKPKDGQSIGEETGFNINDF